MYQCVKKWILYKKKFIAFLLLFLVGCEGEQTLTEPNSPVNEFIIQNSNVIDSDLDASIQFDADGNGNIFFNGKFLTNTETLKISIAQSNSKKIAWAETSYSNTSTRIATLDGVFYEGTGFNRELNFQDEDLVWLNSFKGIHRLCKKEFNSINCVKISFIPNQLIVKEGGLYVSGFRTNTMEYVLQSFSSDLVEIEVVESSQPIIYGVFAGVSSFFQLDIGEGDNYSDVFSWYLLARYQKGDPYAFSNDYMGRVSNNLSYRLQALSIIYKKFRFTWLKNYIAQILSNLLIQFDRDGLIYSKKYSKNKSSKIAFAYDNSLIWGAILDASDSIGFKHKVNLIELSETAFNSYEKQFVLHEQRYYFDNDEQILFDGIFLPWNQQHAIGIWVLKLYELTGKKEYLNRAEDLYYKFLPNIDLSADYKAWSYWPTEFYDGWQRGKFDSFNSPTREPSLRTAEDHYHADISVSFVLEFERIKKLPSTIEPQLLIDQIVFSHNSYSRYIDGDTSYESANWSFFPLNSLFDTKSNNSWALKKLVITNIPEYDNQLLLLSYVKNLEKRKTSSIKLIDILSKNREAIIIESTNFALFNEKVAQLFLN